MRTGSGITGVGVPIGLNKKMQGRLTMGMLARMQDERKEMAEMFCLSTENDFEKVKQVMQDKE